MSPVAVASSSGQNGPTHPPPTPRACGTNSGCCETKIWDFLCIRSALVRGTSFWAAALPNECPSHFRSANHRSWLHVCKTYATKVYLTDSHTRSGNSLRRRERAARKWKSFECRWILVDINGRKSAIHSLFRIFKDPRSSKSHHNAARTSCGAVALRRASWPPRQFNYLFLFSVGTLLILWFFLYTVKMSVSRKLSYCKHLKHENEVEMLLSHAMLDYTTLHQTLDFSACHQHGKNRGRKS